MPRNLTTLITILLLAGAAAADTDIELGNNAKVLGTIEPAVEVETHRVTLPRGALLTVKVQGRRGRGTGGIPMVIASLTYDPPWG